MMRPEPRLRPELLRIDGLHIAFKAGREWRDVVRGVDLRVAPGEVVGLVGESGSGKSLTALAILQVLPAGARISSGRIVFDGTDLVGLPQRAMNERRGRDIAMIFQDPLTALNPVIPIGRQIYDSLRTHQAIGHKAALARIEELLALVGIRHPRERMRAYPHELSGGMRQRVMTALAVSSKPKLLIADEPTTALDVTVQAQVIGMLDRIRRDLGIAVLFISHNLDLIAEICDRVSVMYAGKVVESSSVETVFEAPRHPYTRQLLRCIPRLDASTGPMPTIPGLPPRFGADLVGCPFAPRCDGARDLCRTSEPPTWREPGHLAVCWDAA
ncbi:MAG TPA: ABC transporter ATP-binding protein [Reyranella sp.]|nr:ABC transporter ATP-binding protein [Reyranella sp.]